MWIDPTLNSASHRIKEHITYNTGRDRVFIGDMGAHCPRANCQNRRNPCSNDKTLQHQEHGICSRVESFPALMFMAVLPKVRSAIHLSSSDSYCLLRSWPLCYFSKALDRTRRSTTTILSKTAANGSECHSYLAIYQLSFDAVVVGQPTQL